MRAVIYQEFRQAPRVTAIADPSPPPEGVVVQVRATGLCRSDWHGWMGHDPMISLPHVPGHELAGEVVEVGSGVHQWKAGQRVTAPFVNGCGRCAECLRGDLQICPNQRQPGFTHWGSFAEYVVIDYADRNLVELPEELDFVTAASLGCRFATAFRGLTVQGQVRPGQWVAVHGCGGVGLSAIMIASAAGARIVAVDIQPEALDLARECGAEVALDARGSRPVVETIVEVTGGGAHLSVDALGDPAVCSNSVRCLRRGGTHVQLGLLTGEHSSPSIPMDRVIAYELRIVGSHGMAAHAYPELLRMIVSGRLNPGRLVRQRVTLEEGAALLTQMDRFNRPGVTVIDRF